MIFFFLAITFFALAAILSLIPAIHLQMRHIVCACGAMAGSVCGLCGALFIIITGQSQSFNAAWNMPWGSLTLAIDPLSALFLVSLFVLSFAGSLYAIDYMKESVTPTHWFLYNILIISMAIVCTSANGLLFLLAWETMSLSSFFLVLSQHDKKESREAAWIYLIATHIGAAFLIVFFLLLSNRTGSLDFSAFQSLHFSPAFAGLLFILAVIGFGSKAGFVPFHVWLPKAHPAAPSHVSALMSGIMIKMGLYGILRTLTFLAPFHTWWGVLLIAIGCVSGIIGVLLAIGQSDIKRVLAYSSVENIGIITFAIGLGVVGVANNNTMLAVLGFTGGLLHIVNHSFFKGLLFLTAGSVLHSTHTANMDKLGGLLKKMPVTGACFLIGAVAICGMPSLNGFVSEFFIYVAGFYGLKSQSPAIFLLAVTVMISLATIGGLAAVCFTKAFGITFLGQARTDIPAPHEARLYMRISFSILCGLCAITGLFAGFFVPLLAQPIALVIHAPSADVMQPLSNVMPALIGISIGSFSFLILVVAVIWLRKRLLANKTVTSGPTWDCGYIASTPRIQYTGSSFTQPVTLFFRRILFIQKQSHMPQSTFAHNWSFSLIVPDAILDKVYIRLFGTVENGLSKLRWLQGGKLHIYVLYIAIALVSLLVWNFIWAK